jgi:hypothetical protein
MDTFQVDGPMVFTPERATVVSSHTVFPAIPGEVIRVAIGTDPDVFEVWGMAIWSDGIVTPIIYVNKKLIVVQHEYDEWHYVTVGTAV